ncbi:hypothetical protein SAMN05428962_2365 [Paenibacillus sp. BC26]|nr:hypothetical protein SAMN05428962_2365 [Paenibacillus sp. BC26]
MSYSIQILNNDDREFVGQFFAERPHINTSQFLRRCIIDGIRHEWNSEVQRVVGRINEIQRAHGAPEI